MIIGNLAFSADAGQSTPLESPERRTAASYKRDLTFAEIRLRESLAREEALLRQMDELIQQQDALSKLFAHREDAANRIANLSARQRQIMELVLAGHPSKNIAADLGISQRTVENHRASIMKKTGSRSLPALARLALAAAWNGADEPPVQPVSSHGSTAHSQQVIFTPAVAASSVGILHRHH
jgi:DNA-binding CsgD family transcriptional regulator